MFGRMLVMLIAVGVILGLFFGFQTFKAGMFKQFLAAAASPPQTVSTASATIEDWQTQLEAVGSLRAVNGADLAFEVSGIVKEIEFNSGDDVEAGALLMTLRSDDDLGKLQALQATAELSDVNYKRDQEQFKIKAVSQATLDADAANLKNAKAQVAEQQAVLDKKFLRAPFAGRLGVRAVDIGQFVSAGTTIVTLQSLDPIYVDFFLPQQKLSQINIGQEVTAKIDTFPDRVFTGKISAINPKVDTSTRNVQVRATLTNHDRALLPGMYATVDIAIGQPQRYVTLPQTAVTYNPYGETVFIVDEKGKNAKGEPQFVARQTFVTAGPTRGDQVAIVTGVSEGDSVVTAGQVKLRNGTNLLINNAVKPTADASPVPADQ
jgi:membrane fusion protein, multidrug efflux system